MRNLCLSLAVAALIGLAAASPAEAVIQFFKVFESEYLENHPNKEYAEAVKKASDRCYVCHQGKKSKKHHNAFGEHLEELLDRKKDMKDEQKIKDALAKVMAMHIDPKDDKSETYADRLKASKWPGGELDELKKEPPEQEAAGN